MDKPKSNKVAHFYSGQIQQCGALLLRRLAQFYSGVDRFVRGHKARVNGAQEGVVFDAQLLG